MVYSPIYTSASAVYNKTGLTISEIDLSTNTDVIEDSELECEYLTGRKFTSGNTKTEFFNGTQKDILGVSGNKTTSVVLTEYPVQSITGFSTLNIDGTANTTYATLTSVQVVAGTYDTIDYWLETIEDPLTHNVIPYGKITLKTTEFPVGTRNIKVAYTYGYTTVPIAIRNLATCLAGMRAWINFLGGNYNRLDSYSIPQQSVTKGDFYARGQSMISQLDTEANRILDRIGRRPRVLFAIGGQK